MLLSTMKAAACMELSFDDAVTLVLARPALRLIAIDGLPVSGKSTLADRMVNALGAECLYLHDFVMPEDLWPSRTSPSFPFANMRYDEFLDAVKSLAQHGRCSYRAYDWDAHQVQGEARTIGFGKPIIVEGVSALHPELAPLYDLRIWVDSDAATTFSAALQRGVGAWEREWREMFLPSVDLYLESKPWERADLRVAGRGVR
jgi:uridine kinase